LARYKLDIVSVQEVRLNSEGNSKSGGRGGTVIFCVEKETKIISWEQEFFVYYRTVSAVKRVEFVSGV